MFDNTNPYTLRVEITKGITRYYVSFKNGQAVLRETEVSRPVYLEFCRFIRRERNLRRWDERHIEQSELTDETLYSRALYTLKSVEDAIFDNQSDEWLRKIIVELPKLQRRRFILYHEFGLSYKQIAEIEGRNISSIYESVLAAEEKIKEKMKIFDS